MSHIVNFEYVNTEQFKWHFPINTWQKPMTQEDCPAFSYHVSGLLEKELALPEPRAGSSIKNTLKSTSKELKMRLTTIEIL